jgi:hypothetical protein
MQTAADRYAAIKVALSQGNPELADAIDQERTCRNCGGHVSDDGYSVDPDRCCFYCSP